MNIKIGDLFYNGGSQLFYEIVSLGRPLCGLRQINRHEERVGNTFNKIISPIKGEFVGKVFRRKVKSSDGVAYIDNMKVGWKQSRAFTENSIKVFDYKEAINALENITDQIDSGGNGWYGGLSHSFVSAVWTMGHKGPSCYPSYANVLYEFLTPSGMLISPEKADDIVSRLGDGWKIW